MGEQATACTFLDKPPWMFIPFSRVSKQPRAGTEKKPQYKSKKPYTEALDPFSNGPLHLAVHAGRQATQAFVQHLLALWQLWCWLDLWRICYTHLCTTALYWALMIGLYIKKMNNRIWYFSWGSSRTFKGPFPKLSTQLWDVYMMLSGSTGIPLASLGMFQDLTWIPETIARRKPSVFFLLPRSLLLKPN